MTEIRIIPTYQFDNGYGPASEGRYALEVGNPVILYLPGSRWSMPKFTETIVTRTTKTQVTTAEGSRHYRRSGKQVGKTNSLSSGYILIAADEQMVASVEEAKEKATLFHAEREAEKAAKRARKDGQNHPFWHSADVESVAQVVALMAAWQARHDEEFEQRLSEHRKDPNRC